MLVLIKRFFLLPKRIYLIWIAGSIFILLLKLSENTNLLVLAILINFILTTMIRNLDQNNPDARLINSLPVKRTEIVTSTYLSVFITLPIIIAITYILSLLFSCLGIKYHMSGYKENLILAIVALIIHALWLFISFCVERKVLFYLSIGFFTILFIFTAEWGMVLEALDSFEPSYIKLGIVFFLSLTISYLLSLYKYAKKEY
ncbi:MAG: hypothetical protein GX327_03620 [Epulopiscium sp.]|jgi:hypothetical protein|nr:hypothetical protein [Candidatus Epulonipiscium sp.]